MGKEIKTPKPAKHKPFIVANVKEVLFFIDSGLISYSRGVEMLNEIAANYYAKLPDKPDKEQRDIEAYVGMFDNDPSQAAANDDVIPNEFDKEQEQAYWEEIKKTFDQQLPPKP